ncbi:MAG TPA: alanine racemase [Solirubrobacteraceae bacterium]|nr:alanine racemase [Solirubrobacteraceae bacterium]
MSRPVAGATVPASQRAVAQIDRGAITRNCERLTRELGDRTAFGAVVKADGYGHGAAEAAQAALDGGATWLFVATSEEVVGLPGGATVVVMGAIAGSELPGVIAAGADVVAWSADFVEQLPPGARVHVKLDTGMGRLGTRDPEEATRVAEAAVARGCVVAGLMTHFATADERGDAFFGEQLKRFRAWAEPLRARFPGAVLHAANSAATLRDGASHFDLVRCGIAIYGMDPFGVDPAEHGLEPALSLRSWVAAVKPLAPGQSVGYGRRFVAAEPTRIVTVPIGYGDGWRRALSDNGEVVIGGRRHPIVGNVSMDNVAVDVGTAGVAVGDAVTLLGDGILAEAVAARIGTINYEVTCALTPRVTRTYV